MHLCLGHKDIFCFTKNRGVNGAVGGIVIVGPGI